MDAILAWIYSRIIPHAPLANMQPESSMDAKLKLEDLMDMDFIQLQ